MIKSLSLIICSKHRHEELHALTKVLREMIPQLHCFFTIELIVVEDVSEEPSQSESINEADIYLTVEDENCGFGAIRQKGVDVASHDFIVFIDDDCLPCSEQWLVRLIEPFADGNVVAVGGGILPQRGNSIAHAIALLGLPGGGLPRFLQVGNAPVESEQLSTGNLALRRQAVIEAGGFDTRHRFGGEDQQLVGKLKGRRLFVPEALVEHRNRDRFLDVFGWFSRRGRSEYCINRLAGMTKIASLIQPFRWSWSWRLLLLLAIAFSAGMQFLIAVIALYYVGLLIQVYVKNSDQSENSIVETKRKESLTFTVLLIAPLVKLCMDFGRETGRLAAWIGDQGE